MTNLKNEERRSKFRKLKTDDVLEDNMNSKVFNEGDDYEYDNQNVNHKLDMKNDVSEDEYDSISEILGRLSIEIKNGIE